MNDDLTLLVPYRDRGPNLRGFVSWMRAHPPAALGARVVVIDAEDSPAQRDLVEGAGAEYIHCPLRGPFNKSRLLNVALHRAQTSLVLSYDVDLIPFPGVLERHLQAARSADGLLVAGYRLMSYEQEDWRVGMADIDRLFLGPEDNGPSVRQQLLNGEPFGVLPMFERQRLEAIGGWDEGFVGWGGEDQDVIERYLADGRLLVRAPSLRYLHLTHQSNSAGWDEPRLTEANRSLYERRRETRKVFS